MSQMSVCPLGRPINLDEARAAPSQIFPSAYFLSCLPSSYLPPSSLPPPASHFLRRKSLVIIVAAGSLAVYTAEWRNIYTMGMGMGEVGEVGGGRGVGDDSAAVCWLVARDDARLFPPRGRKK